MENYLQNKKKKIKKLIKARKKLTQKINNYQIQQKRNYILMKSQIVF